MIHLVKGLQTGVKTRLSAPLLRPPRQQPAGPGLPRSAARELRGRLPVRRRQGSPCRRGRLCSGDRRPGGGNLGSGRTRHRVPGGGRAAGGAVRGGCEAGFAAWAAGRVRAPRSATLSVSGDMR